MVWRRGQLLLGQRLSDGNAICWQFPGGHLEADETVFDCARREVGEETGLQLARCYGAGYASRGFECGGQVYLTLYVSARLAGDNEPRVMEPEKCAGWRWFAPQRLPAPLFAPISNFLAEYPDLAGFEPPRE